MLDGHIKICLSCKETKQICEFSLNKNRKDGYSAICKDCKREYDREYRNKNKEKIKSNKAKYVKENREKINEYCRKSGVNRRYMKKCFKDPCKRIKLVLRARMHSALNGTKADHTESYLGCSIKYFKNYIEKQFKDGMSWDNYGFYTWHLDHIKPCAAFDLSKESEARKCFHYTNYQPLWASDNLHKQAIYKGKNHSKNRYLNAG